MAIAALVGVIAVTNAPADRYFGRLKMSTLRIRYETMQLRKRYESHQLSPGDALHLIDLTADAFNAWAAAYPQDAWLPSTGFLLAQAYAELPGAAARLHAMRLYTYVKSRFPATHYAAQSRAALHRGVPLRPQPAWAMRTPPSSATPPVSSPSPSTFSSPAPEATASPPAHVFI